jgi:AcrR family transcriptional regulator
VVKNEDFIEYSVKRAYTWPMQTSKSVDEQRDVRAYILDQAESRFRTYGYRKTTMAELAGDTGMSAANLYRYFVNKQDLGAACANRCMERLYAAMRDIVRQPTLSAGHCLHQLVLTMLRLTHEQASEQPRIHELVEMVANERKDVVKRRDMYIDALFAEVLSRGNNSGEFEIEDVIGTAQTVHNALRIFEVPTFMSFYELPEFEEKAVAVVSLLLAGLEKR